MSAIYGVIDKNKIKANCDDLMRIAYENCKIDKYDEIKLDNVMFGCGLQYLIEESKREILPYEDDEFIFTADAILDNRIDLIDELGIADKSMPDGMVLYEAFKAWHDNISDFMSRLYGIFSFCVYRKADGMIWLVTDHTGSRCVHYSQTGDSFYFGTMIAPIIKVLPNKPAISERYIAYCESNCSADLLLVPELTPYEDIYQLECGCYLMGKVGELKKYRYYYPEKNIKKLKVSDEEGIQIFHELFDKSVSDMLRSSGETAATLSSGLDSTSVACTAVTKLSKKGKKLYSFTSIPVDDYECEEGGFLVENEKNGVLKLKSYYPDIEMNFVNCPGKNAITDLPRMTSTFECPQKSGVNLVWLDAIYKEAYEKNCKVILKGQYGNTTISYGMLMTTVYQLVVRLHLVRAFKEMMSFRRRNGIGMRRICSVIWNAYSDERLRRSDYEIEPLCKPELLQKYDAIGTLRTMNDRCQNGVVDSQQERLYSMWEARVMAHLGLSDTKLGLLHGMVLRDPAKDRRIMELCMSLPITCFSGNGFERRLVREGMKGIVPREILEDIFHRGNQGSDFVFRIQKDWEELRKIVIGYIDDGKINQYLDASIIDDIIELTNKGAKEFTELTNDDNRKVVKLLVVCSLAEFLREYEVL